MFSAVSLRETVIQIAKTGSGQTSSGRSPLEEQGGVSCSCRASAVDDPGNIRLQNISNPQQPPQPIGAKNGIFFEFFLCLSRAWLGKMIDFVYKWLHNATFFAGVSSPTQRWAEAAAANLSIGLANLDAAFPSRIAVRYYIILVDKNNSPPSFRQRFCVFLSKHTQKAVLVNYRDQLTRNLSSHLFHV